MKTRNVALTAAMALQLSSSQLDRPCSVTRIARDVTSHEGEIGRDGYLTSHVASHV